MRDGAEDGLDLDADESGRASAFLTCSARALPHLSPLLAEAERLLLDAGWRTRVPRRAERADRAPLSDRRRLRRDSYDQVERAHAIVHLPAPAHLTGMRLHRELALGVQRGLPVLLLVADPDRARLGVGAPARERVEELVRLTGGRRVDALDDLPGAADACRALASRG